MTARTLKIGNWASYLKLSEKKISHTLEAEESLYIDYDEDHNIVGIEFLFEIKPEYYSDYGKDYRDEES